MRKPLGPSRRAAVIAIGAAASLLLTACPPGGRGLEKPRGSVLWRTPDSGPVEGAVLDELEALGVEEIFQQVGQLSWDGDTPQVAASWEGVESRPRTAVTLVVAGEVPPEELDAAGAAGALAAQLRRLELEAQSRGLTPVGLHLDLGLPAAAPQPARIESLARLLGEMGQQVEESLLLSATLDRRLLEAPVAEDLAGVADFLVVFLYGQRPGEVESPEIWELAAMERSLAQLESLGADYLLGVVLLGQAIHQDGRGRFLEATTDASLRRVLNAPGLDSTFGLSLEASDCQVYRFRARVPTRVFGWRLEEREQVRVVRLTAGHLRRFRERLAGLELAHHLGQAWYRPPRPEEALSLGPEGLVAALRRQPEHPRMEARLLTAGRGALRLVLSNPGGEATEIARVGSNFVELRATRGSFRRADAGEFERYDLLDSRTGERSLRRPDTLRLYAPYLAAGETLTSGRILLSGGGAEKSVMIGGEFLMPDGSTAAVVEAAGDQSR